MSELAQLRPDGTIDFRPHRGQWVAWNSEARFVAIIAGAQSGKTSFAPHWLLREMQLRGPGDYLFAAPSYALLEKKALPETLRLFKEWFRLGDFHAAKMKFTFSQEASRRLFGHDAAPTTLFFGHAANPDSLESATYKAAVLDEAGQETFKQASWEAIQRRLAIHQGRALLPTTPYNVTGWLKTDIFDRWAAGDPDYDVIRFDSTENPNFPQVEFDRARATLPGWKFDLFYRGIFTRPAGVIFDAFIDSPAPQGHLVKRFAIPAHWKRYIGLDFGGINTCAVFFAAEQDDEGRETGRFILYRIYHPQEQRSAADHVKQILHGEPGIAKAVGGAKSEGQWREEFRRAGLTVENPPVQRGDGEGIVEVGINRVYAAFKSDQILIFDDLRDYLTQLRAYSREVDSAGNITDAIADKAAAHFMDATRYIFCYLRGAPPTILRRPSGYARAQFGYA